MNRIRKAFGIAELPLDEPVDKDKLSANMAAPKSAAGAGMEIGTTGQGTAKDPHAGKNAQDKSVSNSNNAG